MSNGSSGGDSTAYGVTDQGFVVRPFNDMLNDAFARAAVLFGPDIDLRSSSSFRKLVELCTLESALAWMALDDVYHSRFLTTASAVALDRLGGDLGRSRDWLQATGAATFKLTSSAPKNANIVLPPGTLVETAPPAAGQSPVQFRLTASLTLVLHEPPDGSEQASATVQAVLTGPAGNIAVNQLVGINATFASRYLSVDPSIIGVSNAAPFTGGDQFEDDDTYRQKLYSLPRSLWTVDAVRETVLAVDGVRDALAYDPYGGLDTATQPFGEFCFSDQQFQAPRQLCSPYFFTITVAPNPGVLWETDGDIVGLQDDVSAAIEPIRPVSIFPTIVLADTVEIAIRVQLVLGSGVDQGGVLAAVRAAMANYINALKIGDGVLFAQVMRLLAEVSGVANVQNLHLRRCPPRFGEIVCGPPARFGDDADIAAIEAPCGGDIVLAQSEVASFAANSPLLEIQFA
jgi:uncharacterized phage protein gp47/JayE